MPARDSAFGAGGSGYLQAVDFGGLSLWELVRRTARESWQDAVFGHGSRMAFYHFLAIFPALLVFLGLTARVPDLAAHARQPVLDLIQQVLPGPASALLGDMTSELNQHAMSGQLISSLAGAMWAALNGTWAMIFGLNMAYEVQERRPWWKLAATIVGLAFSLALSGSVALLLVFFGGELANRFSRQHLSVGEAAIAFRLFEWCTLVMLLLLSFGLLYRFGPNLRDHRWRWSTPGAVFALILWIGSTLSVRFYFEHVNNYERVYGHLNSVVMLLLWLYVTNGAILIGGEMNSEIEKAGAQREGIKCPDGKKENYDRSGA